MLPAHQDLLRTLYALSPSRRDATKLLDDLRKEVGAPPKGALVGSSGPDWSFRLALIWHSEGGTTCGKDGRRFPTRGIIQDIIHPHKVRPLHPEKGYVMTQRMSYARHHYLDTVAVSKEGILKWTRWAKAIGLRHDGEWGYLFPPKRVWNTQPETLGLMTRYAHSGIGKRSISARKERKARRKHLQRAQTFQSVDDAIVYRPARSCRQVRSDWFHSRNGMTWQEFKSCIPPSEMVAKIGCVYKHPQRVGLSLYVELALRKIYSVKRIDYLPSKKDNNPFPRQEMVPISLADDHVDSLRARLEQIELDGFKETVNWFNINQALLERVV